VTYRVPFLLIVSLVLAGIIHLSIVLLIPKYGTRDAWTYLSGKTSMFNFTPLNSQESGFAITEVDPFFKHGVCRFELNEFALKMLGPKSDLIWSASVFNESGTIVYSLNNRTAIDGKLDLLILNPLQTLQLRESQSELLETSVVIETDLKYGFVVLRAFRPNDSWSKVVEDFFKDIDCDRFNVVAEDTNLLDN